MAHFSTQQQLAADNIARTFTTTSVRYAILMARCQSGKTGAFHALIRKMLSEGSVQQVYILCGSNETELRDQAHKDTREKNGDFLTAGKITVLFRQDFQRSTMNIANTLIVLDESHLDQDQKSQLDKFLGRHGLSLDGNPAALDANNAYIVSVDATPYSELASLIHKETPYAKHVEELLAGPGYFGLGDYKGRGLLCETFSISKQSVRFARLLRDVPRKWVLMRLSGGRSASDDEAMVRRICNGAGMCVKYFTTDASDSPQIGSINDLTVAPPVTTVIIIRGRLRAGKVVTKQHIGFVWEGAAAPKTDALVQGLPGRMCGYDFGGSDDRPKIFVSPAALKESPDKVVRASEIDRAILEYPLAIPRKATNIQKGSVANLARRADGRVRHQNPPLAISYDLTDAGYEALSDPASSHADFRTACHTLLQVKAHVLRAEVARSDAYTDEQKAEILSYISRGAPPNFRRAPQPNYYEALIKAHKNKTAPAEHISDSPDMTFVIYDPAYARIPGASPNRVYVVFYTDAKPGLGLTSVNQESRIAHTTGRSVFTPHAHDFPVPIVAGGVAGFREEAARTPEGFEAALTEYLTAWRDAETLTFARRIQSAEGRFSLSKTAFHYNGKDDNDVMRILARVGAAFGVSLEVKFARSSARPDGHFNVKEITW
jgi:hypothetical protein